MGKSGALDPVWFDHLFFPFAVETWTHCDIEKKKIDEM